MTLTSTTTSDSTSGAAASSTAWDALAELKEVINVCVTFRALSKPYVDALVSTARFETIPADELIGREGQPIDRLCLILKGDVDVFTGEALRQVVTNLCRKEVFGAALLLEGVNPYSLATNRETFVATWDKASLARAERAAPGLRLQLIMRLSKHAKLNEIDELYRYSPLFGTSSSVLRHELIRQSSLLQFRAGTSIYQEGEPANYCYLILRGEVEVKRTTEQGAEEKISLLGRGISFGDADIFTSAVRTESAVAKQDTEVVVIDRSAVEALRRSCGAFRRTLFGRIGAPKVASRPQDLILVVSRLSSAARVLPSLIHAAFSDTGQKDVTLLELVPEGYKSPTAHKDALELPRVPERAVAVLNKHVQQLGSRYLVLYTGIPGALEWLASPEWDKVIDNSISSAVYFTDDLRLPFPIETPRLSRIQYVEVRASDSTSETSRVRSGTIRLTRDAVSSAELRYETLSSANRSALQRLARTLSRQAVGVALGGGSAWCYAHVGLLRALHEAGIPVDMVAGTSMGSVIACAYGSRGLEGLDTLIALRKQTAFTLMFAPFTRKPLQMLVEKNLLAHHNLQDMPLPTFPVAVDIQTGRARIFRHGPAIGAMFASAALPTVFPPEILHDGVRYVDGGIANNVPVSALVEEGADFIIASNVIPAPSLKMRENHKRSITRVLSQLSPLGRMQDGLRSMFLLMHEAGTRQATAAQVTFTPSLGKFGLFDYHIADKIVEHVQPELPHFVELVKERYAAFCQNRD